MTKFREMREVEEEAAVVAMFAKTRASTPQKKGSVWALVGWGLLLAAVLAVVLLLVFVMANVSPSIVSP